MSTPREVLPEKTTDFLTHPVEWYIMEVRHRNAVIGVAKQYLIDGDPERALAILRQVGNGIGDADAAKAPNGMVLISEEQHNRLRIAAGENPL